MTNPSKTSRWFGYKTVAILLIAPAFAIAQVPVDDDGNVIGSYEQQSDATVGNGTDAVLFSAEELRELVGPVALYPDDLLAIVLPASAYPLQIAAAARFLDALQDNSDLKPDPDWDDSVIALINYPEIVELMNKDLDWTYRLGEAVIAQQADVVAAVESFRDSAYVAGNLKSDEHQTVSHNDGIIEISPIDDDVIYVPYYEPRRVVVYQPRPVYYYHPHAYPVYYYPYAAHHYFDRGNFWGVTTAFSIGWYSNSLNVFHHSYRGHPYYGHNYYGHHWYRRPSISIYNRTYVNNSRYVNNREGYANRNRSGDRWQARDNRRILTRRNTITRSAQANPRRRVISQQQRDPIRFRQRENRPVAIARNERQPGTARADTPTRRRTYMANTRNDQRENREFRFRERSPGTAGGSSGRSHRNVNTRETQGTGTTARIRQQPRSTAGQPRINGTQRRNASQRQPASVKRTQPRRQEQPPRRATVSKRQEQPPRRATASKRQEHAPRQTSERKRKAQSSGSSHSAGRSNRSRDHRR
jgi:hypothetical protein